MYLETNEAWHALNTQKAADFNINLVTYCTPPPWDQILTQLDYSKPSFLHFWPQNSHSYA